MPAIVDPSTKRTLTVTYPAELQETLISGLSYRYGWRPNQRMPARKEIHKQHPSYDAETNTYAPSQEDAAHEFAIEMLFQHSLEGMRQKVAEEQAKATQEALAAVKAELDANPYVTVQGSA